MSTLKDKKEQVKKLKEEFKQTVLLLPANEQLDYKKAIEETCKKILKK